MAIRDLLLSIDETDASPAREDAALAFAARNDAHLAALYCIGEIDVQGWVNWTGSALEERRRLETERAEQIVDRFRKKAERAGVSYETRIVRVAAHMVASEIAVHARYADMAILGQVDPGSPPIAGRHVVEHVVLACGRPVLVIPYIGAPMRNGAVEFGRNVMVAWNASREATRAVNDAMPVLEQSAHADLVVVNPVHGSYGQGDEPGSDIALHLSRHGIDVEVQRFEVNDLEPGDTILARLADRDTDLLIMGAYGHSRMRELVLGGATRSVLGQMTVPVLMSH